MSISAYVAMLHCCIKDAIGFPVILEHLAVEVALHLVARLGEDVDAEVLAARELHGLRIADGRVEVEVQGQASVGDGASQQGDGGACVLV